MKKIKHFVGDTFLFHKKVLQSKHQGDTKIIVGNLSDDIKRCFSQYDTNFTNDTLQEMNPLNLSDEQKCALLGMYSFKMKPFQELLRDLTTDENNRVSKICPNCTVGSVESLDHCIPKTEFPEFSDNPLNLMPCCMSCNSKKSSIWRKDGNRIFLNLFLDDLPNVRYLFINSIIEDGIPLFNFFVDNRNRLDSNLYSKIEAHYSALDLCNIFSDNSDNVVDDLVLKFTTLSEIGINEAQIKKAFLSIAQKWQEKYGYNYWKSILIFECCKNQNVFNYIARR